MSPVLENRLEAMTMAGTRRGFLAGTAGLAAGLVLSGKSAAQESTPASPPSGEWIFTDDKGVTVTLPARPERIVADVNAAAPLWDFGVRPVAVFGWNATETGNFGDAGGNVDPAAVEVVGVTAEPIQPEKVISVDPDILITITWTPDDPTEYWSIDPAILDQVQPIAPLIAMSATGSADVNTERFAELAAALGADLATPELSAAKETYEAALAEFPTIAEQKQDLSVLFLYAEGETIYVANAPDWADLAMYQSLGLNIVEPEAEPGSYWEQLSIEQALKYPADVVFHSTRPGTLTLEEMTAHPILGLHPAIKARQVGPWNQDFIMSYQGMTAALAATLATIRDAQTIS